MKKYLKFYEDCAEIGFIPINTKNGVVGGLCGNFGNEVMSLFEPTPEDCREYNVCTWGFWGHDDWLDIYWDTSFGPTRQNIVLFLAAMNGEL
jgi:hypothetical protein